MLVGFICKVSGGWVARESSFCSNNLSLTILPAKLTKFFQNSGILDDSDISAVK